MGTATMKDLPREGWTVSKIGKYIIPRNGNVLAPQLPQARACAEALRLRGCGGWPA